MSHVHAHCTSSTVDRRRRGFLDRLTSRLCFVHSYRGEILNHIGRKLDWRLPGGRYGPIYLAFLLYLFPSFLSHSISNQCHLQRLSSRPNACDGATIPHFSIPARLSASVRPSVSLSSVGRSQSGCWGKVGVDRGCWVERSECSFNCAKSRKSLSLCTIVYKNLGTSHGQTNTPRSFTLPCFITPHFMGTLIGW